MRSGDSFLPNQVDPDPMCLASFGDDSTKLWFSLIAGITPLVDKEAAAPKPCLSSVEMRTLTTAGGLLPAGTASIATRTIFPRFSFSWSLGEIKKSTSRTNNQRAPLCRWRVIQTKSRQTLVFDPGGSTGRLRACPFWEVSARCCVGRFSFWRRMTPEAGAFFGRRMTRYIILRDEYDLDPRGSFFFLHTVSRSQHSPSEHLQM